jgi:hypothetical protein
MMMFEEGVEALKTLVQEIKSDPKVWVEQPDVHQVLHRLAALQAGVELLLAAAKASLQAHISHCEAICKVLETR